MSALDDFEKSLKSRFRSVIDDKYLILQVLGVGSYGGVVAGMVLETGAPVAIKVAKPDDETIDHEILVYQLLKKNRFSAEMLHFSVNSTLGRYLVLTQEGQSLHDVFEQRRIVPNHTVAAIMIQLVEGLQFLHSKRVVHRDVSLGNVLVSPTPGGSRCKLVDFGLSAIRKETSYDSPFEICGSTPVFSTPLYVLKGEKHVEVDDYYQLTYIVLALSRSALLFKAADMKAWGAVKDALRFRLRETLPEKQHCFKTFFADIHFQARVKPSGMGWKVETKQMLAHLKEIQGWELPIEL